MKPIPDSSPNHINLKGRGASPGIVKGPARVIRKTSDFDELKDNEIVVIEQTAPELGPFLLKAAGLVTEKGGRFCHAAIFSKERGITAVVGVPNALTVCELSQDAWICANGTSGEVIVMEGGDS